ncbi:MAG: glycosyltransferase [Pseudomonadota bacterium]
MQRSESTCTLILLTYNQVSTVAEAVQAALAQSGPAIEIVITDDASRDGTFEAAEQAVAGYSGPHKVILNRNPENLGLAGNVEKGHALSTGALIVAAAGDDISLPQRCERIVKRFQKTGAQLVCSYAKVIDPDGNPLEGDFTTATFYRPHDLAEVARSKALYIGATGAWRRSLYERYGPMEPNAYEDLVLGFRAALENGVEVIEEPLVKYRLGFGITSSDLYQTDIDAFERQRRRSFDAYAAIITQRLKDAETFGLPPTSPVWGILKKQLVKGRLGQAYFSPDRSQFKREAIKHPLLALYTLHSETRKRKKVLRRAAAGSSPNA